TWTLIDLHSQLWNLAGKICHLAGLRIDLQDVLIAEIRSADELPGRSIELPQDAEFAHLENRFPAARIDQNVLEHFIHVLRFAGKMLVVPLHFAGIGIERESRVG